MTAGQRLIGPAIGGHKNRCAAQRIGKIGGFMLPPAQ